MLAVTQQPLNDCQAELGILIAPEPKLSVIPEGKSSSISSRVKQHVGGGGGTQHGAKQLNVDI
jgi:hypothetical protein